MLKVTVYPDTDPAHTARIYAGLAELEKNKKIKLKYIYKCPSIIKNPHEFNIQALFLQVEDSDRKIKRNICFDMEDNRRIGALTRLKAADVYFKRSYCQDVIDEMSENERRKILPFGLNYECNSESDKRILLRRIFWNITYNKYKSISLKSTPLRGLYRSALDVMAYMSNREQFYSPLINDFVDHPTSPTIPRILFQSRVWNPEKYPFFDAEELEQLNEMRAKVVRALKSEFGDRFVGGLAPNDYAKYRYPDCITNQRYDRPSYLNLVKQSLITVTTTGLQHSEGWKLAEFLAASKCIVSEPPRNKLPFPFEDGVNYISLASPEECVEGCDKLFRDTEFATAMRFRNYEYYTKYVDPDSYLYSCLERALNFPLVQ